MNIEFSIYETWDRLILTASNIGVSGVIINKRGTGKSFAIEIQYDINRINASWAVLNFHFPDDNFVEIADEAIAHIWVGLHQCGKLGITIHELIEI